jgi:hypothetical protein
MLVNKTNHRIVFVFLYRQRRNAKRKRRPQSWSIMKKNVGSNANAKTKNCAYSKRNRNDAGSNAKRRSASLLNAGARKTNAVGRKRRVAEVCA